MESTCIITKDHNMVNVEKAVDEGDLVVTEASKNFGLRIGSCANLNMNIVESPLHLQIENCQKLNITFPGCMLDVQIHNCSNITIVSTGPTGGLIVDQTRRVDFTTPTLPLKITTTGSSEITIRYLGDDKMMEEIAIPDQMQHTIDDQGKLTSRVSDNYTMEP